MRKRFIARKQIKNSFLKGILIIFITLISFWVAFKYFSKNINLNISNEQYINYLVNDALGNYKFKSMNANDKTEYLLKYTLGIQKTDNLISQEVFSEVKEEEDNINDYPIVYIYNSHQTEGYKSGFLESFNINNTVLISSYILREYLNDLGISVLVEENKIIDILNTNGWKYSASYNASRILMEAAAKNNPTLKYFIDIHRDASSYNVTTTEIEEIKYAKVLFVVGLEHENYSANLEMAQELNELIKKHHVSLTRGIMQKEGVGVNGIYNQDFSSEAMLIEVGGQYNTIEEVNNTLKILAQVLYDYIEEDENGEEEN